MAIGRFYLKRGEYNAAINRFRSVVKNWQTTSQVPEALERLVEAYVALGLKEEARHVAAVLGHNYPGDPWYQERLCAADRLRHPPARRQGLLRPHPRVDILILCWPGFRSEMWF